MTALLSGSKLTGPRVQKIVGRGNRITNATAVASTTEQGILRLDGMSVKGGYLYWILVPNVWVSTTDITGIVRFFLHKDASAAATTSSPQIDCTQMKLGAIATSEVLGVQGEYIPSIDETISVLLSYNRAAGAGTVTAQAGTNNPVPPMRMYVVNMGLDPGDTGVDL
jgi:hypothetical protein